LHLNVQVINFNFLRATESLYQHYTFLSKHIYINFVM
jgi:hypothetical protein